MQYLRMAWFVAHMEQLGWEVKDNRSVKRNQPRDFAVFINTAHPLRLTLSVSQSTEVDAAPFLVWIHDGHGHVDQDTLQSILEEKTAACLLDVFILNVLEKYRQQALAHYHAIELLVSNHIKQQEKHTKELVQENEDREAARQRRDRSEHFGFGRSE